MLRNFKEKGYYRRMDEIDSEEMDLFFIESKRFEQRNVMKHNGSTTETDIKRSRWDKFA